MPDWPVLSKFQRASAVSTAILSLSVLLAGPALASRIPCSEALDNEADSAVSAFMIETAGHNATPAANTSAAASDSAAAASLLAPRAEKAIKDAFREVVSSAVDAKNDKLPAAALSLADSEPVASPKASSFERDNKVPASRMQTKLPGLSDVATARFKKQMFRRDI